MIADNRHGVRRAIDDKQAHRSRTNKADVMQFAAPTGPNPNEG